MTRSAELTPAVFAWRVLRVGPWSFRVRPRVLVATGLALAVLGAVIVASLLVGSMALSFAELLAVFTGDARPAAVRSVIGRRLPRALTALLVGGCLGMSGAAFQSLSRNPLGSPDIIGFTTGSATAAVIQIVVFGGGIAETAVAAVIGGIITALVVYLLARRDGVSGGIRLVLVGIGVGAVLSAVTSLLVVRADINDATTVQLWSSGSLIGRGWPHVVALLLAAGVLVPLLVLIGRQVSLMEMGDDTAAGVGVRVERTRFWAVLLAVTLAAAATAAAGPIAFIAFAAPQIVRRLVPTPGVQLWLAGLTGAILLTGADLLAQNLDVGLRTPVGLVTSLLGGLYLLWLLARRI